MQDQINIIYSFIILISLIFVLALRNYCLNSVASNRLEINKTLILDLRLFWFLLAVIVIIFCFFISADFIIAAFYSLFISVALLIVFLNYRTDLIKPQGVYSIVSLEKAASSKFNFKASLIFSILCQIFNIIILAPLLSAIVGVSFHALLNIPEVDLVVYTAFVASISFAIFITYFASTKNHFRAFLYGLSIAFACLVFIVLSGKVMMK